MSKANEQELLWQRLQAEQGSRNAIRLALDYGGDYLAAAPERRVFPDQAALDALAAFDRAAARANRRPLLM